MTCLDSSAISGMACRAWRKDAAASAKLRSSFNRAPISRRRSCWSGVGVLEASSGGTCSAFLSFGRFGTPSTSMMPEKRWVCTPNASRIEPATTCILAWSWLEKATSMTKKLMSSPMRSANVTNQP